MKMMAPGDKEQAGGDRRNPWGPQEPLGTLTRQGLPGAGWYGGQRSTAKKKKKSKLTP